MGCNLKEKILKILFLILLLNFPVYSLQEYDENEIKAALIHKILTYVEWPSNAVFKNAKFLIKVVGFDEVAKILAKKLNNTIINGLRVKVVVSNPSDDLSDANLIYLSNISKINAQKILNNNAYAPILIISNELNYYNLNFHISLFTVENKVKFTVDMEAAKKSNLLISSKLVQVARKYGEN